FSEFIYYPLGWITLFDGQFSQNVLEITNWSEYEFNEQTSLTLKLPCLWTQGYYPLDFRSPPQIQLDIIKTSLERQLDEFK
ncbi:MAG: hypothetical protein ABWZ66_08275, partial [Pyrinomonadaceae bacterium]